MDRSHTNSHCLRKMSPLPFKLSLEAEDYLKARKLPAGCEAGITPANRFEVCDSVGKVTDRYEGLHFNIGYDAPGRWSGIRMICGNIEFWITEGALEELKGKTLKLIRRYEGNKRVYWSQ